MGDRKVQKRRGIKESYRAEAPETLLAINEQEKRNSGKEDLSQQQLEILGDVFSHYTQELENKAGNLCTMEPTVVGMHGDRCERTQDSHLRP